MDMDAADTASTQGARALYSSLVPDQGTKVRPRLILTSETIPTEIPTTPLATCAAAL